MKLRVAAVRLNQTPLDWSGNQARLLRALHEARREGAQLVCFPELCISGYGAEDAFFWPETLERSLRVLEAIAPETRGLVVAVGLPIHVSGGTYNASAVLCDGGVLGFACKRHLAQDGLHYEPRWFRPWPEGLDREVDLGETLGTVPVGDLVFEIAGLRFGFEICEDAWVPERPGRELFRAGVDLILNPSASHFAFGKERLREELVLTGSADFECAYVYANLVGNEAGRSIYDGDALVAQGGRLLRKARRFSFSEVQVLACDLELLPKGEKAKLRRVVRGELSFVGELGPISDAAQGLAPDAPRLEKEQELASAIALGLFDYGRKSRSRGFVVSLSGGADSAVCALLVRYMVRLAVLELGLEKVRALFGHSEAKDEEELIQRLLTTIYQATENSGPVTRQAAAEVARELSATHHEVDVDGLFREYRRVAASALGRELSWPGDDVTLQNLQARVRAPSAWTLANVRSALLLSTSNRSEAAVGYATMDGDTAGGLAPIAGVDKHFIRKFLVWAEQVGLEGLGPARSLRFINAQAPTAELRPPEFAQTDEKDLMPYEVLDTIERLFVQARRGPRHVLEELSVHFPAYDRLVLFGWMERFFQLFARNQWKRERYAPSFHLDDLSLDPKTWCRFPILSGGFADELAELRAELANDQKS